MLIVSTFSPLSDLQGTDKSRPRSIPKAPASELLFEKEVCGTSLLYKSYVGTVLFLKFSIFKNAERAVNRQPGFRPENSPSRYDAQNTRHTE